MSASLVLVAAAASLACVSLGGGLYEALVLDPVWPSRPAIVQPQHGGVSRRRFWIPVHTVFEVVLVAALIVSWPHADVRTAMLVALGSQLVMRGWSFVDFIPKAVRFEKQDPATIERSEAVRWTRRSLLRLPLDALTCIAAITALVLAA